MSPAPIHLEVGTRKVFAGALDWPGWCRAGRTEEAALEALASYSPRYAPVAAAAGVRFPASGARSFEVVERATGSATTDFGAPGRVAEADRRPLTAAGAKRLAALVEASWTVLDEVVASSPPSLRKGPRGGGRDRDAMVAHVLGAETSYARTIGVRMREPEVGDAGAVAVLREAILDALRAARSGEPRSEKGWPPRYTARRMAWHVLDHAWEMEDRRT